MKPLLINASAWTAREDGADPQHQGCCVARDDCLKRGFTVLEHDVGARIAPPRP